MKTTTKDKVAGPTVIPASAVDAEDIRCPGCRGDHLILSGFLQRVYTITTKAGEILTTEAAEGPWVHDVKVIQCQNKKCNKVYNIISDEMWTLMQAASTGTKSC